MSIPLVNQVRPLTGLTFAEKSILYVLADASYDGVKVFLRMDKLCLYAGCSERTARRNLRRLEEKGVLVPQGPTGGRGYVHVYHFNLSPLPKETLPPDEPDKEAPQAPPPRQFKNPPSYDDPRRRKEGETFMEYSRRIESLK